MLVVDPNSRLGCGASDSGNSLEAIKRHPFFADLNFETFQTSPVPLPLALLSLAHKKTTVKRVKVPEESEKIVLEIKRGFLKKKNEWFIQQTRTFVLTNEPRLRYYRNQDDYRVRN